MTPEKASKISQQISDNFKKKWNRMRGIWRSKNKTTRSKAKELIQIFKSEVLKAAKKELNIVNPENKLKIKRSIQEKEKAWDQLTAMIGNLLGITLEAYTSNERPTLDDPIIQRLWGKLHDKTQPIPTSKIGWQNWWNNRDSHRAETIVNRDSLIITDRLAATNPKKFYKQVTKPLQSSHISSLRKSGRIITSDVEIEKELTNFIENLAKPSKTQNQDKPPPELNHEDSINVMEKITMEELISILKTLDNTSSPGYDGISPGLLKAITLNEWEKEVPMTKEDEYQKSLDTKFRKYCEEEEGKNNYDIDEKDDHPSEISNSGKIKTKTVTQEPNLTRQLLLRILNLCLEAGDIPDIEKLGIITGLPKSEGLVSSTDDMRPITVGTAISRLLHKILAHRLSSRLVNAGRLDPSQFAFLPGGDIHEPISSTTSCYRDRLNHNKNCYAIYYDISKAYDTIRWESIKSSLENLHLEPRFINFVMTSLKNSRIAMRTNITDNITPEVELHKSIKQGCPLAPLLFIIVMDELHKALRNYRGYTLETGETIRSRGYCDDTYIVSDSLDDLKQMNEEVLYNFFNKHSLKINTTKTKLTGRHQNGTPLTEEIFWPDSITPFKTVPPNESVRYLGIDISMDLDWTDQVNYMQGLIMNTIYHLKNKRLSFYQGISLTKYVTGPKMELGMKHANVPRDKLKAWDKWIANALAKRAGVSQAPSTSIYRMNKMTKLEDLYDMTKLTYALDLITTNSELKQHYENILKGPIKDITREMKDRTTTLTLKDLTKIKLKHNTWRSMTESFISAATKGLWLEKNHKSCKDQEATPEKNAEGTGDKKHQTFQRIKVPIRDTHTLWGSDYDKIIALKPLLNLPNIPDQIKQLTTTACLRSKSTYHHPKCSLNVTKSRWKVTIKEAIQENLKRAKCGKCPTNWAQYEEIASEKIRARICTDGSTYPGKKSGAALCFISDGTKGRELWHTMGYYWKINMEDNYIAELSAIHKAIRSIPVNVNLDVHTDSKSGIDAITTAMRAPAKTKKLRTGGRPYIMSICRAITARGKAGGETNIKHVRAHTGKRDIISIGNACVDRLAKWCAKYEEEPKKGKTTDFDLMKGELPYILYIMHPKSTKQDTGKEGEYEPKPIHGDIRKAARNRFLALDEEKWSKLPKRGKILREHTNHTIKTIDQIHSRSKGSIPLTMTLEALNNITLKAVQGKNYLPVLCQRCGNGSALTILHRTQTCPCNNNKMNNLDDDIAKHTGYKADQEILGPSPTNLLECIQKNTKVIRKMLEKSYQGQGRTLTIPDAHGLGNDFRFDMVDDLGLISTLYTTTKNKSCQPLQGDKINYQDFFLVMSMVKKTTISLTRRTADEHGHTQAPSIRLICRQILRTYSDLYYNPLTEDAPWDATWHSLEEEGTIIGGTYTPHQQDFLKNRYTWITGRSTIEQQLQDLETSTRAVTESTSPTRIVMLMNDTERTRKEISRKINKIRKHCLISLDQGSSVKLRPSNILLSGRSEDDYYTPTKPMIVVLIENTKAPGFDPEHIRKLMKNEKRITIHDPPRQWYISLPPDQGINPTKPTTRHHPLLRPSQTWYRADVEYTPNNPDKEYTQMKAPQSDKMNRNLSILGLIPSNIKKDIENYQKKELKTDPGKLLSTLIYKTSLDNYTSDKYFRNWTARNKSKT